MIIDIEHVRALIILFSSYHRQFASPEGSRSTRFNQALLARATHLARSTHSTDGQERPRPITWRDT